MYRWLEGALPLGPLIFHLISGLVRDSFFEGLKMLGEFVQLTALILVNQHTLGGRLIPWQETLRLRELATGFGDKGLEGALLYLLGLMGLEEVGDEGMRLDRLQEVVRLHL